MLEVRNVSKKFEDTVAVDSLDFKVRENEIFGLIGADGAGKTSLIRMLCGIMEPNEGDIIFRGRTPKKAKDGMKPSIGYMPQKLSLYGDLTVLENLHFFADLYLTPAKHKKTTIKKLIEFANLGKFKNRLAQNLSGGMKQKLGLACCLIHHPKLLLLDEPTNGVDPLSRREFWSILKELQDQGVTIIISTPYMDEAEQCDSIGLLHKGKMIYCGRSADITKDYKGLVLELITGDNTKAKGLLATISKVESIHIFGDALHINITEESTKETIQAKLKQEKIHIESFKKIKPTVEDTFIYLIDK